MFEFDVNQEAIRSTSFRLCEWCVLRGYLAMSGFAFGNTGFGGLAATPAGANTFLALCQNAVVECGAASRSSIPTVLPSVNTTVGSLGRIVKWVNEAWLDIQMELDDWEWMRSTNVLNAGAQFQTIAGQPSYPLGFGPGTVGIDPDAFGKWDEKSFYSYTTSVGKGDEVELDIIPFESWRSSFMYGANRFVRSRPVAVALGPDQSVCLGPPSNGLYTI